MTAAPAELFPIEFRDNVAILHLMSPKANSMSPQMLAALRKTIEALGDSDAQAIVVTGKGRAFCAGLALPEIVDYSRDQLREFMVGFGETMEAVLTCPKPTVAAINGHAIAGGCVLALMCDYRIMAAGDGRIGLNEAALGIGLPSSVIEPLRARVPARSLGPIALAGELFSPEAALDLQLIDEVEEPAVLLAEAIRVAAALSPAPEACAQIKAALQRPVLEAMRAHGANELERWLDTWFSMSGQTLVRGAVASLKK